MSYKVEDSVFGSILIKELEDTSVDIQGHTLSEPRIVVVPENPRNDFTNSNTICLALNIHGTDIPKLGFLTIIDQPRSEYRYELTNCSLCETYDKCSIIPTFGRFGENPYYITSSICSECFSELESITAQLTNDINTSQLLVEMLSDDT